MPTHQRAAGSNDRARRWAIAALGTSGSGHRPAGAIPLTLGFALVYLGEHYLVDLLVGATLTESVRAAAPVAGKPLGRIARALQGLERRAHA